MLLDDSSELVAIIGSPRRPMPTVRAYNEFFAAKSLSLACLSFEPESAENATQAMRKLHFRGMAVTMPFKSAALRLADCSSAAAARVGACNTLYWQGDQLAAENTDVMALSVLLGRARPSGSRRAVVLGAGGAARAAVSVLGTLGFETVLCARNRASREAIAADFSNVILETGALDAAFAEEYGVVINATPIGFGSDLSPLPDKYLHADCVVVDFVFHPAVTRFIGVASTRGCDVISGMDLLVAQAVEQLRLWSGSVPDETQLRSWLLCN
jgi:shikimate dehydrogenase